MSLERRSYVEASIWASRRPQVKVNLIPLGGGVMIEGISAVTLGTHDMRRAVRFYRSLGFDILHGGEASSFTSFRAGMAIST
jgi:hypothetical protein